LVFIDEFGVDTALTRSHARSLKGERAKSLEPFNTGKRISVIGALSLNGVGATMSIEGAVDTEVIDAYVQHFWHPLYTKEISYCSIM